MNSSRIKFLLTGVAAWISLLLMITTTYGGSIVIGGDYTDVGTIVVISPKPGDTATANGTALLNNLAAIPSDPNQPYLIKLGPGIYDLGAGSLQMKQYVDIEGSGENTTIITGHIDDVSSGVVQGASNAEIRFLTVRNTGGGTWAVAIYNSSVSPKMTNVTALASGGGSGNFGVRNYSSSPTMTNVTATGSGGTYSYGVSNIYSSSPTMTNVTASASEGDTNIGVYCNTGTIRINHSVIKGKTNTVYNTGGATTLVGNTQLDGGAVFNISSTLTCAGVYDENYTFYASTCP
jgi:hypothetical protein